LGRRGGSWNRILLQQVNRRHGFGTTRLPPSSLILLKKKVRALREIDKEIAKENKNQKTVNSQGRQKKEGGGASITTSAYQMGRASPSREKKEKKGKM